MSLCKKCGFERGKYAHKKHCRPEYLKRQHKRIGLKRVNKSQAAYKAWIAENGPCRHCGSAEQQELDHIDYNLKDPALRTKGKARGSSVIFRWGLERREKELANCQVLCRNCHLKKTSTENKTRRVKEECQPSL